MKRNIVSKEIDNMQQLIVLVDSIKVEEEDEVVAHQRHKDLLLSMLHEQRETLAKKIVENGAETLQKNRTLWKEEESFIQTRVSGLVSECKELEVVMEEKRVGIRGEKKQAFELQELDRAESQKMCEKTKEEEREVGEEKQLREKISTLSTKIETQTVLLSERVRKSEEQEEMNTSMSTRAKELSEEIEKCRSEKLKIKAKMVTIEQEITKLAVGVFYF
jgi:hypothetical protein